MSGDVRRDRGARIAGALGVLCLVVGTLGYLYLVGGFGAVPDPRTDPGAAAGWLARYAPVWLVLWLVGAGALGTAAWRKGGRGHASGGGREEGRGRAPDRVCPQCGAPLSLRRRREGPHKGAPYWVCREHGEIG